MRLLYFLYFCRRKVVKDFRCKILRGKQVRILYSTRCCKFQKGNRKGHCRKTGRRGFGNESENLPRCVVIASGGRRMHKRP